MSYAKRAGVCMGSCIIQHLAGGRLCLMHLLGISMSKFFESKSKNFKSGIQKLVEWWKKVVSGRGSYYND